MALELLGITKRFGAQLALDDVSITVADGDCYGFIGHNGAGKTTAMRIALGLQRQDSGLVRVDGFDARHFPREARARLGALIETPGFQGGWSGTTNLAELARLQGLARAEARREAARWIEHVGLAHAGLKPVQAYSQGMRQRLGIAAALIGSPRTVLLDEPTNGLDPEGMAEIRELIGRLRREHGLTFLVSSHQLHELSAICNRVGILRGGRLVVEDEQDRLLGRGEARYRLETPDAARASAVLAELGISATSSTGVLELDLAGRTPAAITRALVERGVGVNAFAPRTTELEEIYLRASREAATRRAAPAVVAPPSAAPREKLAPSAPIGRMFAFDVRRFARSAGVWFLLAAPLLLGAIAIARRGRQGAADIGAIEGQELFSATGANGFEALGLALQAGLPALVFLVLGLSSQSLAAEYGRGTLRNVLLRPMRRFECALGKWGALIAFAALGYVALAGVSFALAGALFEYGDVCEVLPNGQRFTLTPAAELWPVAWRALAAPLAPLVAYSAIGFLAGAIARTGASALALALGFGVVLDLARALMREFARGGYLPSDHVSSPLSDTSYLRFFVDTAQGASNATLAFDSERVWVPIAWAVVCFLAAARILQNRSIP